MFIAPRVAAFLVLAWAMAANSSAAEIVVRAVNGKDGKPLLRCPIQVYGRDDVLYPREHMHLLAEVETDREGRATFQLEDPLPDSIFIYLGGRIWFDCSSRYEFSTKEVLSAGVVPYNRCDKKGKIKTKFFAKPGEIIIFDRPFTRWDYLKQEVPFP